MGSSTGRAERSMRTSLPLPAGMPLTLARAARTISWSTSTATAGPLAGTSSASNAARSLGW